MATVNDAIEAIFAAASGLTALVSTRFYYGLAPQDAALPFVTWQRISTIRETAMGDDPGIARARIQVSSWSSTLTEAESVKEQVRAALQRYRGTIAAVEILDAFLENEIELIEPEPRIFQIATDFSVIHRES